MSKHLQYSIAQAAVFILGAYHAILGLAMIIIPSWFFENIGNYPPFNQHYIVDFGAYQFPLGIALVLASRQPFQQRLLVGSTIIANILHAFAHVYDDLANGNALSASTVSLLVLGSIYLFLAYFNRVDTDTHQDMEGMQ